MDERDAAGLARSDELDAEGPEGAPTPGGAAAPASPGGPPILPGRVNILEDLDDGTSGPGGQLEAVRLDGNEVVVVPFTPDSTRVRLHYCDDPELRGYVHCNEPGCILCRAGRVVDERLLMPVYAPAIGAVAVLAISPSSRPGALLPQVRVALRSGRRVALLIHKPDRAKFAVRTVELTEAMDDGAAAVAAFVQRWESGGVDLGSIYPHLDDRDLAEIESVATMLKYRRGGADA